MRALVVAACMSSALGAGANESGTSFRLAWVRGEGADACVDERELERGVRARLGRDPFNQDAAQSIEGDIAAGSSGWRAQLRVRDASGTLIGRRALDVPAGDCSTLTDALVLAIALVIEPRASFANQSPATPSAASPAPAAPPGTPGRTEPEDGPARATPGSESRPASSGCPTPPRPAAPACPVCRVEPCAGRSGLELRASLRALGAAGILPHFAPGLGMNAGVGVSRFRFSAGTSYFPEQEVGDFAFGLSTVDLGACVSANPIGVLIPSVCAHLQAGAMHAVVRELQPLRPGDHVWAGITFGPEVALRPFAPLVLETSVLAVVPVLRPRFAVRGDAGTVFESQTLGAVGFVGVGLAVP